jgi:hypothetical protein
MTWRSSIRPCSWTLSWATDPPANPSHSFESIVDPWQRFHNAQELGRFCVAQLPDAR